MIREVYKGIMKAVDRRLTIRMTEDLKNGKDLPYESYLMTAEAIAYEETCKAFRVKGEPANFQDMKSLMVFASQVVSLMGIETVRCCERSGANGADSYISLSMPNRTWKMGLSPIFLSTVSPVPHEDSYWLQPCLNLAVVLPDLDRMMPVLERMTGNILNDIKASKEEK